MSGYTKLFNSILSSTIWREDLATKVVWVTMLAMADRDGIVEGSIPGLAHLAGATIQQTEASIQKFLGPDPYSRTPEHEGRRIEKANGGWRLLNAEKYRDRLSAEDIKERNRIRQARWRERHGRKPNGESVTKTLCSVTDVICDANNDKAESIKQKEISISSNATASDQPDLLNSLRTVWDYYISKIGRDPRTYSFTPIRKRIGMKRLKECLDKADGNPESAVKLMQIAIDKLAASDWHIGRDPKTNGKKYCEWEKHLFKTFEQMEWWWNQ
jgi:hypothetical protein